MKNEALLSILIQAKRIIEPLCDGLPVLRDEPIDWRVEHQLWRKTVYHRIPEVARWIVLVAYVLPSTYSPSFDGCLSEKERVFRFCSNKTIFQLEEFKPSSIGSRQ